MSPPAGKSHAPNSRATKSSAGSPLPSLINLTPRDILLCIRERGLVALVISILVCTLLGAHLLRQPKVYQTQARLIFDRNERIVDIAQVRDQSVGFGRNDVMFDTYLAQINSPAVINRVVDNLKPEEKKLVWRPYANPEVEFPSGEDLDNLVRQILRGGTSASRYGTTLFLNIKVSHRDPDAAALLANQVARQFILYQSDRNTLSNNSAIAFLRSQTQELQAKAEASERALQKYREQSGMVSLDESQNIVVDRMKSLSGTVTGSQVARLQIEARLRQAESILAGSGDPLELATTAEFSNLATVQSQIDQLRTEKARMGERYGAKHPAMIENQRGQEALERLRAELVQTAMANLRNQQAKALSEEQELRNELAAAEKESMRLDQMAIQFNVLKRDAETNRATYAQLLNRLNETTVTAQLENSNLRIVEEATPSRSPISPDVRKINMMLILMGVGIFLAYPITLELIFNRIRGWSDIENYLKVPLLAELPSFKKIPKTKLSQILSLSEDESAMEIIRSLYSQIKLSSKIDLPKTILVTSTIPGEGKSFVASNLAESFASHGVRTLLVDVDFRRPTQHRSFAQDNEAGILRWISDAKTIPPQPELEAALGILKPSPNLHLLRTGGTTRQSTEILGNPLFISLFESIRQHYDLIVFDTPPAGVFPDAMILAERTDELIYVVRYNHVARPSARRVISQVSQTGITQLGVVLNLMPSGVASSSYYSGYGHYGSKYYREAKSSS